MKDSPVICEFGPFPGIEGVHGVTFDGQHVWFASGEKLNALDPESGQIMRSLALAADAGTAFDGRYLYQIAESKIHKIDPDTGAVLATIPAPANGGDSGMAWAEGSLWVGHYRERKIHEVDPATGKVLRTLNSDRFVTGISWLGDELWHATWEGEQSELRRIDPRTGVVKERIELPAGVNVSGLESNGRDRFFCGGGPTGKVRVVRRSRP